MQSELQDQAAPRPRRDTNASGAGAAIDDGNLRGLGLNVSLTWAKHILEDSLHFRARRDCKSATTTPTVLLPVAVCAAQRHSQLQIHRQHRAPRRPRLSATVARPASISAIATALRIAIARSIGERRHGGMASKPASANVSSGTKLASCAAPMRPERVSSMACSFSQRRRELVCTRQGERDPLALGDFAIPALQAESNIPASAANCVRRVERRWRIEQALAHSLSLTRRVPKDSSLSIGQQTCVMSVRADGVLRFEPLFGEPRSTTGRTRGVRQTDCPGSCACWA